METKKIIQKIAITLIVLSVVVLVGLTVYQQQQIKKLSSQATSDVAPIDSSTDGSPGIPATVSRQDEAASIENRQNGSPDIEYLEDQLDAAEEELNMVQNDLSEELDKKAEMRNSMAEMQRQQLQNPATKKMIRDNLISTLQSTFGPLFEKLALSDEKQAAFLDLMADQQMEALDQYSQILGTNMSEEEKKDFAEQTKAITEKNKEEIIDLLGSENSETYLAYSERLQERQVLSQFLGTLGEENQISDSQEEALIEAMYEGRKVAEDEEMADENEALSPTDLDEEKLARFLEALDGQNAAYLESAEEVLTEAQVEQFKSYLDQQRQMQEAALRMTSGLFGN